MALTLNVFGNFSRLIFPALLIAVFSLSGCKAGVPVVKSLRKPLTTGSSKPSASTKMNFATSGSGGVTVASVSGVKIKFTVGYNQMGQGVGLGGSGTLRPSSSGVLHER